MSVIYPRKMRERAKADRKGLVTIDLPGMTFQGPVSNETIAKLLRFVLKEVFPMPVPDRKLFDVAASTFEEERNK